mgnify:CR=1 FL=1
MLEVSNDKDVDEESEYDGEWDETDDIVKN